MRFLKSMPARLLACFALIFGTHFVVWKTSHQMWVEAKKAESLDLALLPRELAGWSAADVNIEDEDRLLDAVGSLTMVNRNYERDPRLRVQLHAATFPIHDIGCCPHPPISCYQLTGWQIKSDDWKTDASGRRYRL